MSAPQSNRACRRLAAAIQQPSFFEELEPRQLNTAGPTPGDGHGYVFLAGNSDDTIDTLTPQQVPAQVTPVNSGSFQWLDATGRVSSQTTAVGRIVVEGWYLWPKDSAGHNIVSMDHINEADARSAARHDASIADAVVLDIENWPFDIRRATNAQVDDTISRIRQVIGWFRDEEPQLKISVYGLMPINDPYGSTALEYEDLGITKGGWFAGELTLVLSDYARWQAASEYLRPLANDCDFIAPSLYTMTTDIDYGWTKAAQSIMQDAQRFGKPVIPVLYPRYHQSVGGTVGGTLLSVSDWEHELDTVHDAANGVIVWDDGSETGDVPWIGQFITDADIDAGITPPAPAAVVAPTTVEPSGSNTLISSTHTINSRATSLVADAGDKDVLATIGKESNVNETLIAA